MWAALERHTTKIWAANVVIVVLVIYASVFVDGNGRLPGLDERASMAVGIALLSAGLCADCMLAIVARGLAKLVAVLILAFYIAMVAPAFL
ncbi:MAG: hypothetical protein ACYTF6_00910 [Planctomycetota bacterium]|jgi:hypothetical protein